MLPVTRARFREQCEARGQRSYCASSADLALVGKSRNVALLSVQLRVALQRAPRVLATSAVEIISVSKILGSKMGCFWGGLS